jgi:sugar lactone lactonase YvrE
VGRFRDGRGRSTRLGSVRADVRRDPLLRDPITIALGSTGTLVVGQLREGPLVRLDGGRATTIADGLGVFHVYVAGGLTYVAARDGAVYRVDGSSFTRVSPVMDASSVAVDAAGNLYVTDRGWGGSGRVVWRLGTDDIARIIAGTGRRGTAPSDVPARQAALGSPQGLCVDTRGRVYFADSYNHVVLRIDQDGTLRRVAGTGRPGHGNDGVPANESALNQPYDVRVDPAGNLYIADFGNHRVRRVAPDGTIRTVAGTGKPGYSGDGGPATRAQLHGPYGVFSDAKLGLLIADTYNHVIRAVDRRGRIRTLAGTGTRGYGGDGGPALSATFDSPQGLAMTSGGSILVGDEHNHAIRVIEPGGMVRLLVGSGRAGFSPDGTPAEGARLADPENMLAADEGAVLFTEAGSGRVRYVGSDGRLGTVVGAAP